MRIYKGSEITLKLYTRINCQSIEADKMRVVLFTTNPNNSCIVNNIVVSGNTLLVTIGRNDLNAMEDGVINYIILGYDDNEEIYNSTRQSNYYLKTPDGYVAKSIQTSKDVYIVDNGDYKILPDEDYSSIEEVNVHVEFDAEPYIQRGIELGEENQKSKLESVSITENGIYTREDGYNEIHVEVPDLNGDYQTGYDEGYEAGIDYASENAGEIAAQTAQVLNITENGTYLTQYSEPIIPESDVTGYFDDGTEFKSYAELNGEVFDTKIPATPTTRLELWYKGDNTKVGDAFNIIIGAEKYANNNAYQIRYDTYSNNRIRVELGYKVLYHTWDEDASWHHILIAKETEDTSSMSLWVDEVKVGDFTNLSFNPQSTFYINGIETDLGGARRANGCFGMVKIDDTIIIPTADGFLNTNTGELLEVAEEGEYVFTDTTPEVPDGNLIKTVNVNVQPKIDVAEAGIKFGYSSFTTLPEWADFSNVIDYNAMFYNCNLLINAPMLDTSNITNIGFMYYNCTQLENVPNYNTENVADARNLFYNCVNLNNPPTYLNLLKCDNMEQLFYDVRLKDYSFLTNWDINPKANMNRMITAINYVEYIPAIPNEGTTDYYQSSILYAFNNFNKLTYFGGWIGRKYNLTITNCLPKCPNLTYESCISILNNLYDFTGNGEVPQSSMGQLKVHQNFLTTVGEEINIATAKGWIVSA